MSNTLLDSIEARLQAHAAQLDLSPLQQDRARSLAVASVASGLIGLTSAELFALVAPAYEEWRRRNLPAGESVVQQ